MRGGKGLPSLAEQGEVLRAAGIEADGGRVYTDTAPKKRRGQESTTLPELDLALRSRRVPGDELWVSHPCVFATSEADARLRLARLTERQATLCIASTGRRYRWHPDAADGLQLAGEIVDDLIRWRTTPGRAAAEKRRARQEVKATKAWKEAERLWKDDAVTVAQVAERTGLAVRTLYRRLGPKGTALFTGGAAPKPKARRK